MELFLYIGEYAKTVYGAEGGIVKIKSKNFAECFNKKIVDAVSEASRIFTQIHGHDNGAVIIVPYLQSDDSDKHIKEFKKDFEPVLEDLND